MTATGLYDITAYGAQGGNNGGLGAKIGGDISLTAGETLDILVGGSRGVVGGGGGSYIASSTTNLVETAGFQSGNGLVTIDLATPIPPALWLVGSALTRLLGLRRRKPSA